MKPDLEKAISMAVNTGKVKMGYDAVLTSVMNGKVKTAVISNNIPGNSKKTLMRNCNLSQIPIIEYEKSGIDLGAVCGRPHKVSVIGILDPGNSKILEYL
ncbi:MAG: 50S ribosomal protein L30e [Candidatus Hodarchaeales archaeon]|jgi:large subunit ribosomal protein L30e